MEDKFLVTLRVTMTTVLTIFIITGNYCSKLSKVRVSEEYERLYTTTL